MSKDLFKEAIADAKAVREAALANAKAALEESMTPKLQSMIAAKLQEMELEEDLDEDVDESQLGFLSQDSSDEWQDNENRNGALDASELEEDFDLSEILAELEEESLNEAKEEKEEDEEETEETKEETEEEVEDSDEEEVDLSDPDSLKAFVEKIVQDAISQMDAGAEPEGEESMDLGTESSDDESITVDENQEINLEEILNEMEMEENLYEENLSEGSSEEFLKQPKVKAALLKFAKGGTLTPEDVEGIDMDQLQAALKDMNAKASSLEEDLNEEQIPQFLMDLERNAGTLNTYLQQNVADFGQLTLAIFVLTGIVAISTAIGLTAKGPKKEALNLQKPIGKIKLNLQKPTAAAAKAAVAAAPAPAPVKSVADSILSKLQKAQAKNEGRKKKVADEKDEKDLKEALKAINTLKSELNEVNLLNAKLIYVNKIFRAKNLTESQKIEVLASFDKATTVKEAQLVFESLNSTLNTTVKKQIKESLGFASKAAGVAPTKRTIVESDDVIARMQRLANIK